MDKKGISIPACYFVLSRRSVTMVLHKSADGNVETDQLSEKEFTGTA